MKKRHNSRGTAALMISRWLCRGEFPGRQLDEASVEDRPFVTELVQGVVRWKRLLEWAAGLYVRSMPKRELKAFLLVGAYEILLMRGQDYYAGVNEIIEAVKAEYSPSEAGFVNAVMRRLVMDKAEILAAMRDQPMCVRTSHPDILIERWRALFGDDRTLQLCDWNNSRASITLRINGLLSSALSCLGALRSSGVFVEDDSQMDGGWIMLGRGVRVTDLPGYGEGHFAVMDRAAGTAVDLLDPRPGEVVLDACAAPGGKTFLLAERMRKKGRLLALELNADRLIRLHENLRRLRCDDFVEVMQGDATLLDQLGKKDFDSVLLDVPCSNTGVIRRKPDVRWRFSEAGLGRMVHAQRGILRGGLNVMKPGGRLVYSTCSLEPDENELVVRACLADRPDVMLVDERKIVPPGSRCDGAYAALLTRRN